MDCQRFLSMSLCLMLFMFSPIRGATSLLIIPLGVPLLSWLLFLIGGAFFLSFFNAIILSLFVHFPCFVSPILYSIASYYPVVGAVVFYVFLLYFIFLSNWMMILMLTSLHCDFWPQLENYVLGIRV